LRQAVDAVAAGPASLETLLPEQWLALAPAEERARTQLVLEAVFEHARVRVNEALPSRADCAFAWRTLDVARRFAAQYVPGGTIYRCTVIDGIAIELDGGLLPPGIDLSRPVDQELPRVLERAGRYWRGEQPMTYPELLLTGTVIVDGPAG